MLRGLLERLSRGRVLRRLLPPELGGHTLLVSPDVALRYWRADLAAVDPALVQVVLDYVNAGDVVWDVGAGVGLFAFGAAYRAGPATRVLAVEPDPWLAELMRRSARELPPAYARVDVLEAAVSEAAGRAHFRIARRGRAASHLARLAGSTQTGGERGVLTVDTVTLDALLADRPAPALVKVDVEGAEVLCLRGATWLLSRLRPLWLCEVYPESVAEVTEIFHRHGYVLLDAERPAAERRPLDAAAWNTLALPAGPSPR